MQDDKNNTTTIEEITSSIISSFSKLTKQLDQYNTTVIPVMKQESELYESAAEFFDTLSYLLFGTTQAPQKSSEPITTFSGNTGYRLNSSRYSKEEVIAVMRSMRKEGATLLQIADYLKDKGIPTFSGRGEWHAQTVHRLCR